MPSTPERLPTLTLEQVRDLERSGTRIHLVPSIIGGVPEQTPPEQALTVLRGNIRLQLLVVTADPDDQPTDEQLGFLEADPMQLDAEDALALETCDRLTQQVRARTDALLPQLLDAAAITRRGIAIGAAKEEQYRASSLATLRQAELTAVAFRHQWQGSMYHQFARDKRHTGQHRERFRQAMTADYDRVFQALGQIETYVRMGA